MLDQLEKLQTHAVNYRHAVDLILASDLGTPKAWEACFEKILICTAQLYLDYLLVKERMQELESLVSRRGARKESPPESVREMKLRAELAEIGVVYCLAGVHSSKLVFQCHRVPHAARLRGQLCFALARDIRRNISS